MQERNSSTDDRIEKLFKQLARAIDDRARELGESQSARHQACRDFLRGGYNCWELWKRAKRGAKQ